MCVLRGVAEATASRMSLWEVASQAISLGCPRPQPLLQGPELPPHDPHPQGLCLPLLSSARGRGLRVFHEWVRPHLEPHTEACHLAF